jgi:hypothetical protein
VILTPYSTILIDITMTNVLYVLLQKIPRVRIKIRTCKVTKTVVPVYCGHYDHQTMVTPLVKWGVPSKVPVHHCQQWWLNKEYNSAVSSVCVCVIVYLLDRWYSYRISSGFLALNPLTSHSI